MNDLPLAARLYVTSVMVAGAVVLGACLPQADFTRQPLLFAAFLTSAIAVGALKVNPPVTTGGSTISMSCAVDFASLLLIGPHPTMLVAAAGALSQSLLTDREPKAIQKTLFAVASVALTVQGAGLALAWLTEPGATATVVTVTRPIAGAAIVYFLLKTGLSAAAVALSSGQGMAATWQTNFLWSAPSYFVGAGAAALGARLVARTGYWFAPLAFAPIYLTYRTCKVYVGRIEAEQQHVQQTSALHLATIEALARAIDAKDQHAQMHLRRVQTYAAGVARALGLSELAIQGVKTAAVLHDIGKLAVPEHILSKPGPLTEEEFQKVRIHPEVGAEIIAGVPFPYPVAPIVRSHHERWDGTGYPQGLSGVAIPIGARILATVDYFDAVTSERPYHKAAMIEDAIALLQHEAGRALDPAIVKVFVDLLPALLAEAETEQAMAARAGGTTGGARPAAARRVPAATAPNAFENIALAHREIYTLYDIAQSMGTSLGVADTMALISSKLAKIVPWSGCSAFLMQGDNTLKCRFAVGVEVPQLLNRTLAVGAGLSGEVARTRRTLVNVRPSVTFGSLGLSAPSLKSAIVCPLYANDTFIGSLALYHVKPHWYTEDHRRMLEQIAEQAGPVIHNSIVFEQTQEESLTDPLTGLPNRRSMFAHLTRELARAERVKEQVGLIVMDFDGLKAINDTYGHHVGDHALREVSLALQGGLRPYDVLVRYAGDEFIVVLSNCPQEVADAKRRELQDRVSQIDLEVRAGHRLKVAVSAGTAVFPDDGSTYEALLAHADRRMYQDKAARRDQIVAPCASRSEVATDVSAPVPDASPSHEPLPHTIAS